MSRVDSSSDSTDLNLSFSSDDLTYYIQPSVKEMLCATAYRTGTTTEMDKTSNEWKSVVLKLKHSHNLLNFSMFTVDEYLCIF